MRNYLIFLLICISVPQMLQGQKVVFDKKVANLGSVLWKRPTTAKFEFTNKGKSVVVIDSVDAGCGCIDVDWTKTSVAKGERGLVSLTYDAQLLGYFDRHVDVFLSGTEKPLRLRVKGRVSTGEEQNMEELFPCRIGDVLLSTNNIEFSDVHKGDSSLASFEIYNDGEEVYTPILMHLPSYVRAEYSPAMLGRGKRGVITLVLDTDKMPKFGMNQTSVYLSRFIGDKVGKDNKITLTSVLLPEVDSLASTLSSPSFKVSSNLIEMGRLGKKSKIGGSVTIYNKGNGVLRLESIEVYNEALQVTLPQREIMPGKSIKMKVSLIAEYLETSVAEPRVLILTNDPHHVKETITIKYEK